MNGCRFIIVIILKEAIESWVGGFQRASGPLRTWDSTDCSQITNLPVDTQILKERTTWRNLPSIFLILHDFNYLPRFFSVSDMTAFRLSPPVFFGL
jgi:hypothetical protein